MTSFSITWNKRINFSSQVFVFNINQVVLFCFRVAQPYRALLPADACARLTLSAAQSFWSIVYGNFYRADLIILFALYSIWLAWPMGHAGYVEGNYLLHHIDYLCLAISIYRIQVKLRWFFFDLLINDSSNLIYQKRLSINNFDQKSDS